VTQLVAAAQKTVRASVVAAALFLLAWSGLLFGVLRRGQKVALEIVPRRSTTCRPVSKARSSCFWGYYWREVYHAAPLIAAQLLFAYGFDIPARRGIALLPLTNASETTWIRRRANTLLTRHRCISRSFSSRCRGNIYSASRR
jgi:hypothetical protein